MDKSNSKAGEAMKEIGGYFELDQFKGQGYYDDLIKLNTGRNALIYLILAKQIKKIYLPYFLCNSIANILIRHNIDHEYYHIDEQFLPIFSKALELNEFVLVVNYYGQLTDEQILKIKSKYKSIILDNTQSFFQRPLENVDTFYSCRKYFGVSDGAYLATDTEIKEDLAVDRSHQRMRHILGRFEELASDHYLEFKDNDKSFITLPLRKMSKLTDNILKAVDYDLVKQQRNTNFTYLNDSLYDSNGLSIIKPNGPFAYPYYIKGGDSIRKKLAEKKIYIPILWPNVLEDNDQNSVEYNFAANIIPIPCDQRYSVEDMEILIKELSKCIN